MSSHTGTGEEKEIDKKEKEKEIKTHQNIDIKPKIPMSVKDVVGLEYITEG